jgi:hypothetical protein
MGTLYFATEVRRPGVSLAGMAFSISSPLLLSLEEDEHDRLLSSWSAEHDDLRSRKALPAFPC